ncbi:MAG: hypothetical protein HUJ71_10665, partial [Pseudobutyrivibrio sp.]|nr:hypothetical protein [Pseudobutyrivibrio sp.]
YDVIGFVHDKKTSHAANNIKWEIELWNRNIWENMLASESYIYEVLDILHNNDDIGLLCPPEPIGDIMNCWYSSGWGVSYDVTLELARRLRLDNADIDEDYLPVTIGTVFWAKREALRKLLDYDWSYEDFPTEPMPLDGTISHGVERILGYVAQDAGYKTGTIQTCDYAATMLNFLQSRLYKTFDLLKGQGIVDFAGVDTVLQSKYPKFRSDSHDILSSFVEGHENIYIYGAGTWAKRMIRFMADNDFEFTSVLVSDVTNNPSYIGMHPVFLKDIVNIYPDDGIIIAIRNNETSYQIAQSLGCDVLMLSALI